MNDKEVAHGIWLSYNKEWNLPITLVEIGQSGTNASWFYLLVEPKEQNKWGNRTGTDS